MQEIQGPCHECILLQKTPSFLLRMMSSRVKYLRGSSKSNRRQVWQIRNSNYYHPGDMSYLELLYTFMYLAMFSPREGGEQRDRLETLMRNKNLEPNFSTLGIRIQFKVPHGHFGERFWIQSYPPHQEFQVIWSKQYVLAWYFDKTLLFIVLVQW